MTSERSNPEPFTCHDPFDLMSPEEFESYRNKLLAVSKSTGAVLAATEVRDDEPADAPLIRLKKELSHVSPDEWYVLPGPPAGDPIDLEAISEA